MQLTKHQRHCPRCGYETDDPIKQCPQCGNRLVSANLVRGLGWLAVVLGVFLIGAMVKLIVWMANIISEAGRPGAASRFTGTPLQAKMIFGLFGLVLLFGVTAMVSGIWQIRYGKRNRKLAGITFLLGLVLLIIGMVVGFFR